MQKIRSATSDFLHFSLGLGALFDALAAQRTGLQRWPGW